MIDLGKFFEVIPPFFRRRKLLQLILLAFPDSRIQRVEFNGGALLYADIRDRFPQTYFLHRGFEPEFFSIAAPFLGEGGVFFDAGAHFGFCTFGLMHFLAGKKTSWHLFEANPEACELLKRSAGLYPGEHIRINNCVLLNRQGASGFLLKKGHLSGSYVTENSSLRIPNLRLDAYISDHGIRQIDFLKMDIEGSEPLALRGAMESLKNGIVKVLYLEISNETLGRYGFSEKDCLDVLRESGFRLFHTRSADFSRGIVDSSLAFELKVNGASLRLAPLKALLGPYQTDILAIHESSPFCRELPA